VTTQRVLLLVAAVLLALTAASFALGQSRQNRDVDPVNSDLRAFLPKRKANDLRTISAAGGSWDPSSGQWTLDSRVPAASLQIGADDGGWNKIRSLKLNLAGSDAFEVRYTPKRESVPGGKLLDEGASELRIPKLQPGKPLELTVLEHGGQLEVRRLGSKGPAVFRVK